jgi:hypothetical protein
MLCKIKRTTAENFYIFLTYRIYSYKSIQIITKCNSLNTQIINDINT